MFWLAVGVQIWASMHGDKPWLSNGDEASPYKSSIDSQEVATTFLVRASSCTLSKMTSEIETKRHEIDVEHSCVEDADRKPTTAYALQPKEETKLVRSGLERRLLWKQDLLILPLLALIYFVTFLARTLCSHSHRHMLIRRRTETVSAMVVFSECRRTLGSPMRIILTPP